jgi:hypothetical protein
MSQFTPQTGFSEQFLKRGEVPPRFESAFALPLNHVKHFSSFGFVVETILKRGHHVTVKSIRMTHPFEKTKYIATGFYWTPDFGFEEEEE